MTFTKDSYERMKPGKDELTLVAGDSDYVPIVEDLVERAFKFDVAFWDHASRELRTTCSKFISLNKYLEHLRLHPSAWQEKGSDIAKLLRHLPRAVRHNTALQYNADMSNISEALAQLETERVRLTSQIEAVRHAISALNGSGAEGATSPRKLSTQARARIAAAQRARWAKVKGQKVVPITVAEKRKLSASALAKIRAGQKKRWAAWRRKQKSA